MADSVEDADGSKAEVFFEVVEGVSRGQMLVRIFESGIGVWMESIPWDHNSLSFNNIEL